MFKRLKLGLFASEVQKQLQNAKIDKTHELVQTRNLPSLVNLLLLPKSKNQFLNQMYKGLNSSQNTLVIKTLIVIHSCIRKTFNEEICDMIMSYEVEDVSNNAKKDEKSQANAYIRNNIINFYILYLKKLYMHKQSYQFVKQYTKKILATEYIYQNELEHEENIDIVTHGFKILNLIYYILQSQQMFNKMGRYHMDHKEILTMYMQFLQDMDLFNNYVKNSVKAIISKNSQIKMSLSNVKVKNFIQSNDISIDPISVNLSKKQKNITSSTKPQSSGINIVEKPSCAMEEAEEIKHYFLYINQSQKISDRLYEFYHNRYYYKVIKHHINFPTFLILENKEYTTLKNKVKKIDRNLVNLVKRSKYDGETTLCVTSFKTEPAIQSNKVIGYEKSNLTELDDDFQNAYSNITADFANNKMEQNVIQEQQY